MKLDAAENLSTDQAVTDTDAYTEVVLDLGNVTPKRDIGKGEPMCLAFVVGTAAAGSTDTTDIMAIQSVNSNGSSHKILASRRIANSRLTAGSIHIVPIPPGSIFERYFGGRTELGTGDTVTWKAVYLAPMKDVHQADVYQASGFTVD